MGKWSQLLRVSAGRSDLTVSEIVAVCCSDGDAAVTVIVDVMGCIGGGPLEEPAPPHQLIRPKPATLTSSSKSIRKRRRFFSPTQQSTTASGR
jgi:hypothetical protein